MRQYLDLLQYILDNGEQTADRTGTGIITVPGYMYVCPLSVDEEGVIRNFPLLTTKFVSLKSVFQELMWKLRGETNIRSLLEQDNHIWTEWPFARWLKQTGQASLLDRRWKDNEKTEYTDEWKTRIKEFEDMILSNDTFCEKWGETGHIYGYQFRHFGQVGFEDLRPEMKETLYGVGEINAKIIEGDDQLMDTVNLIKADPTSRRIIISLWNSKDKDESRSLLSPCPTFYQFFANNGSGKLHLNMYQRSCDTFLGVPYNTAQDALFLCMMAHVTGRKPGQFTHMFGDVHIYLNHINQVKEQLSRTPHELPSIKLNPDVKNILDFTWEDIELIGYEHEKSIKAPVSV